MPPTELDQSAAPRQSPGPRTQFLDPDDPRVSPLNLTRIRLLRQFLYVVLLLNVVPFLVILVAEALFLELNLLLLCIATKLVSVWCFAMPAYYGAVIVLACFADYYVEKGKVAERLRTPDARKRASPLLTLWKISLSLWLQAFDMHEKPWGTLVPVNGDLFRVHLACYGDVLSNSTKQPIVPSPVSVGLITEYLMEAFSLIYGPFSAVDFDIGGLYSRVFALRNRDQIHSLVGPNKNEKRSAFRNDLELMDSWQGFLLWLRGLVSPLGITKSFHWFFHPRRFLSKSRIFGSDIFHCPKYLRAQLQEQIIASLLLFNEMRTSDIDKIPLAVVLSDSMIKQSLNWGKWPRELTKLSSRPIEWVVAEGANHCVWDTPKGRKELQQLLLRDVSEKNNTRRS
ncbi:hypothetical protein METBISCDRAFT_32176 [Metschnikowia bicuspidata]|uniref:Uncharacterized protein n=1 Tax=Metschnikowia bicuspidata TaxID=27322 RepID=A0A4P9Z6Z9_9ASCO|nr:hypothetical protein METBISCDRAFT_32176 [Metschnikowia bicuspidata]